MKIKEGFVLHEVADAWLVFSVGSATVDFNSIIKLNESGVLLWRALEQNCDRDFLINVLLDEYEINNKTAASDVDEFIEKLIRVGCIDL